MWTTAHIHTTGLIVVQIECSLAHQGNAVLVDAHGRTVDTASDATHIHGAGKTRTIVGHREVGDIRRQFAQVVNSQFLYLKTAERGTAQRLLAKTVGFLGL